MKSDVDQDLSFFVTLVVLLSLSELPSSFLLDLKHQVLSGHVSSVRILSENISVYPKSS